MALAEDLKDNMVEIQDMLVVDHRIQINESLFWDYDRYNNALITGGLGKTNLLISLVSGLLRSGAVIDIAQLGTSDFVPLGRTDGLKYRVFYSEEKALRALKRFSLEMHDRLYQLRKLNLERKVVGADYLTYDMKPHFFVIDELALFMNNNDYKYTNEFSSYLKEIALLGSSAGFYFAIGTSDPKADILPSVIKDRASFRVVLGRQSDVYYSMVFGKVPEIIEDEEFQQLVYNNYYNVGVCWIVKPLAFVSPTISDEYDVYSYFEKLGESFPTEKAPGIKQLMAVKK